MATKQTTQRPQRTPVSGPRNVLSIANQDPNYVYRWVNSTIPGRVERFLAGGYEVVLKDGVQVGDNTVDKGSPLGSALTRSGGGNTVLVAMRILREYFDEDQAAKQAEIDALEESMLEDAHQDRYGSFTLRKNRK